MAGLQSLFWTLFSITFIHCEVYITLLENTERKYTSRQFRLVKNGRTVNVFMEVRSADIYLFIAVVVTS